MIKQSRADTVSNLAAAALLINRAGRIDSQVIQIRLTAPVEKTQRHRSVRSPKRLLRARTVVERAGVLLGRLDSEDFKAKRLAMSDDSRSVEARLHVHAFVVIHQPAGSIDQLLLAEPQGKRPLVVESAADIHEGFMKVTLVLVDTRTWPGVVAHLLVVLERSKQAEVRPESQTCLGDDSLKPVAAYGLWACAPVGILEPFIFGAGFETESQIKTSRRIERYVL